MKLFSTAEKAIMKKDFGEIWNTKMARNTLLLLPILLVVILPAFYIALIYFVPADQINGADEMLKLLPAEAHDFSMQQSMFYMMTNYLCPMFFLMIPLMVSSISAASSFVGEKERSTMETLLLTPMSLKQIFKAKVFGCIILSGISTLISFIAFSIVTAIGDIILKMPFFLNWNWLVLLLFFAPAITVLGVIFMVLFSGKSKSYMESFQTSSFIVVPVILLFMGQFTGLFQLNALILLLISIAIILLDIVLLLFGSRSFTPEKLLK
jgi:ABC-type Na+ efflux pump permease subunit